MWKKKVGVFACILFLLMVSIPIVNADFITYPKENGPYSVVIRGRHVKAGMGGSIDLDSSHIGPFWNISYPLGINYDFGKFTTFIVNGTLQNMKDRSSHFKIKLLGFKGFAPTLNMMVLAIFTHKNFVIGICDEIKVIDLYW